ncbi:transposase, partial [Enterobacter roggenkampii]
LHQLARQLFKTINRWLAEAGVMMTQGTLVDATIIEAPSSTKNKEQQRDPEMHQTKKGNQWHFGMKAHIGVDAKSGLTHSLVTTAANEHWSDHAPVDSFCPHCEAFSKASGLTPPR